MMNKQTNEIIERSSNQDVLCAMAFHVQLLVLDCSNVDQLV
jgi:hypothetical protein